MQARSGTRLPLVIVAAMGRNNAIGRDNSLPWSMPSDLARFKTLTMGTPMIMGRRTYEAIGRPLPGRESIVVSRNASPGWPDGVFRVGDPDAAYALAQDRAQATGATIVTLIGGATLFSHMLPRVDRLAMTLVDLSPDADTFFPTIDPDLWRETARLSPPRHPDDEAGCMFVDYVRR